MLEKTSEEHTKSLVQKDTGYVSKAEETMDVDSFGETEPPSDVAELKILEGKITSICASQFSGPLPPPEILIKYNDAVPDAAERILSMAEREAAHRHAKENKQTETDSRDSLLGIIFAFVLGCLPMILGTVIVIMTDNAIGTGAGLFLSVSGIGVIISHIIKGTTATWKNGKEKKQTKE